MQVTHRTFKTCRVCESAVPMPHLHQTHLVSNPDEPMHINMFDESDFVCETCSRIEQLELNTGDDEAVERPSTPTPEAAVRRGLAREDLNQAMAQQRLRIAQTSSMIDLADSVEAHVTADVIHSYKLEHDRAMTRQGHLSFSNRLRSTPHAGAEMALQQVQEDPDTRRRISVELSVIDGYADDQEHDPTATLGPLAPATVTHIEWWLAGLSPGELMNQEESETNETVQNDFEAPDLEDETGLPSRVYEERYGSKPNISTNF